MSYWFAENTLSETRIFHSLITLSLAIILLYRFESPTIKNALEINTQCQKSLKFAFSLLVLFIATKTCLYVFQLDSFILILFIVYRLFPLWYWRSRALFSLSLARKSLESHTLPLSPLFYFFF